MLVENTHEKVVGTVHLVTDENVFVAKSSAVCTSCTLVATDGTAWTNTNTESHPTCCLRVEEKSATLEKSCDSVCVCVSCTQTLQDWGNSRMRSQCDQTHKHADKSTCQVPWAFHVKGNVNRSGPSSKAAPFPGPSSGEKDASTTLAWGSGGRKCSSFQQGQTLSLCILPPLHHSYLLSIRDWTLCTSSRATFRMCWTSCRSAISVDQTGC